MMNNDADLDRGSEWCDTWMSGYNGIDKLMDSIINPVFNIFEAKDLLSEYIPFMDTFGFVVEGDLFLGMSGCLDSGLLLTQNMSSRKWVN